MSATAIILIHCILKGALHKKSKAGWDEGGGGGAKGEDQTLSLDQ